MTLEDLAIILALPPEDAVKALQTSSFAVPAWSDLEKQYDATQHDINDEAKYPPKLNDNNVDDFERTALSLQKLAVNRMSQAMFATPVKRLWNYDKDVEAQKEAIDYIEELYRVQNNIDSENLERAKKNNASCEIVTVWSTIEKPTQLFELQSNLKLVHKTYAAIDGYSIYAVTDAYGEYVVISIGYKADVYNDKAEKESKEFLDVYTNQEQPLFIRYINDDGWKQDEEASKSDLAVFPCVHTWMPEPVWGGDVGSRLVDQLEKQESYQGLYITRNALPTFTLDMGDTAGMQRKTNVEESANDSRRVIETGKGGKMNDVTWDGAPEAVKNRYERLRNSFFEQNQIPDTSFANLINSNTSAENKALLFADSKAKAIDLGGEWTRFFYDETQIVIKFASIMFPSLAAGLLGISSRSVIVPYDIKSKKEIAEFVSVGSEAMSLETKIRELDVVDDVQQEIEDIQEQNTNASNQLL